MSFFNTMDPNDGTTGLPSWPQWSWWTELLHFLAASNGLIKDDFRSEGYEFISKSAGNLHI
jgi:hypothetical protein